jgi:hypothetical protein
MVMRLDEITKYVYVERKSRLRHWEKQEEAPKTEKEQLVKKEEQLDFSFPEVKWRQL